MFQQWIYPDEQWHDLTHLYMTKFTHFFYQIAIKQFQFKDELFSFCLSVNILVSFALLPYHLSGNSEPLHVPKLYFRRHQKCIDRWKTVMLSFFSIAKKYRGWKYHWNFENQHWVQNQGVNTLWPKKLSGALLNCFRFRRRYRSTYPGYYKKCGTVYCFKYSIQSFV